MHSSMTKTCRAFLQYDSSHYRTHVAVRHLVIDPKQTTEAEYAYLTKLVLHRTARLLRLVQEVLLTFVEGYNMADITRKIICSHCLEQHASQESLFEFTQEEVLSTYFRTEDFVFCCHLKSASRCVSIKQLAPDISMEDLPLISDKDITMDRELGKGGFGTVYGGTLRLVGGQRANVAVKTIRENANLPASAIVEFQREAALMSEIKDPHIVKFYGVTKSPLRLVIELISGGDLMNLLHPPLPNNERGIVDAEQLPWKLRLLIALDVARGMKSLHREDATSHKVPIIHRDLRSPNIFIDSLSLEPAVVRAKVADFGLSRCSAVGLTGALGSWQWVAPEVLEGIYYDERSDIYSYGICCWELATRQIPFSEYDDRPEYCDAATDQVVPHLIKPDIIYQHLRPSMPPPEEGAPPEFLALIRRCWSPEPNQRPSFTEIEAVLMELLQLRMTTVTISSRRTKATTLNIRQSTSFCPPSFPTASLQQVYDYDRVDLQVEEGTYLISAIAVLRDWLAITYLDGTILLTSLTQSQSSLTLHSQKDPVLALVYVPFTKSVWAFNSRGNLFIWVDVEVFGNVKRQKISALSEGGVRFDHAIMQLVQLEGGRQTVWVATSPVYQEQALLIYNSSGILLRVLQGTTLRPFTQFGAGGPVWVAQGKSIEIYDPVTLALVVSWVAHPEGRITALQYVDGVWSGDETGMLYGWQTVGEEIRRVHGSAMQSGAPIVQMIHLPSVERAVSLSTRELIIWEVKTGKPLQEATNDSFDVGGGMITLAAYGKDFFSHSPTDLFQWKERNSDDLPTKDGAHSPSWSRVRPQRDHRSRTKSVGLNSPASTERPTVEFCSQPPQSSPHRLSSSDTSARSSQRLIGSYDKEAPVWESHHSSRRVQSGSSTSSLSFSRRPTLQHAASSSGFQFTPPTSKRPTFSSSTLRQPISRRAAPQRRLPSADRLEPLPPSTLPSLPRRPAPQRKSASDENTNRQDAQHTSPLPPDRGERSRASTSQPSSPQTSSPPQVQSPPLPTSRSRRSVNVSRSDFLSAVRNSAGGGS